MAEPDTLAKGYAVEYSRWVCGTHHAAVASARQGEAAQVALEGDEVVAELEAGFDVPSRRLVEEEQQLGGSAEAGDAARYGVRVGVADAAGVDAFAAAEVYVDVLEFRRRPL
jgi:hypothetical protein